jgi:hypothetical protein
MYVGLEENHIFLQVGCGALICSNAGIGGARVARVAFVPLPICGRSVNPVPTGGRRAYYPHLLLLPSPPIFSPSGITDLGYNQHLSIVIIFLEQNNKSMSNGQVALSQKLIKTDCRSFKNYVHLTKFYFQPFFTIYVLHICP